MVAVEGGKRSGPCLLTSKPASSPPMGLHEDSERPGAAGIGDDSTLPNDSIHNYQPHELPPRLGSSRLCEGAHIH
jgi:hypothetical protein